MGLFQLIVILALIVTIIVLILWNANVTAKLIEPSSCPQIKGTYGVVASSTGTLLNKCGPQQTSACQFDQIATLQDAINLCNTNANVCNGFVYSSDSKSMFFIDTSSPLQPLNESNSNIYLLQSSVTISG